MHDVYTITATTSREGSNRRSTSQIRRTCDIAVSRDQMIFSDYINAMSESGKLQFSRSNDIRYQKQNAHTTFKISGWFHSPTPATCPFPLLRSPPSPASLEGGVVMRIMPRPMILLCTDMPASSCRPRPRRHRPSAAAAFLVLPPSSSAAGIHYGLLSSSGRQRSSSSSRGGGRNTDGAPPPRKTLEGDDVYAAEEVVKRSRFVGYAANCPSWDEARAVLEGVRADRPRIRHVCFGYVSDATERSSDDGEPSSTTGGPILGTIRGEGLTDALCAQRGSYCVWRGRSYGRRGSRCKCRRRPRTPARYTPPHRVGMARRRATRHTTTMAD